jgi:hypothetical protein
MPSIPSSQTKSPRIGDLQQLRAALERLQTASPTLSMKVKKLRSTKSTDAIQQLQSDVICELYDLVRELQVDLFPSLLGLPDVGSVRAGLHKGG